MRNAKMTSLLVAVVSVALAALPAAASLFMSYDVDYGPEDVPDALTTVSLAQFD